MQETIAPPMPIRLADVFPADAAILRLANRTKEGVVGELVHRLVEIGRVAPDVEQSLTEMVLARERLGSTAIGNGIAFPHCRSSVTETFVGAVAIDREGVSFNALDKGLVHMIFLLVGPLTNREEHFHVLGQISSIGRHQAMRWQLCGCRSGEEVHDLLREWDADSRSVRV
jgi:mannitol/fructose-specific phosphotransferase system IIA component (Ntr-type)